MKICYPFPDTAIGGAEKYARYLAKEAIRSGNEVLFTANKEGEFTEVLKNEKIPFKIIPMQSSFNPFKVIRSAVAVSRLVKAEGVQIFHAQFLREHSIGILASLFQPKLKIIRTFHRLDQFNWKMSPLMWLYNLKTTYFIAPTRYIEQHMAEQGIKKEKIKVVFNGAPEVQGAGHKNAIGYLGRISSEKGILEFAKKYNLNYPLLIAGLGPDLEELKQVAGQNKNIQVLGHITDIKKFFSDISVQVLPSKSEVLPLSVIESFSAGVPVVSFDIEPLAGIVTAQNGSMVKPGNFDGLVEECGKILTDKKLLGAKSKKAKEDYLADYTVEKMWILTESLYNSSLN